MKPLTSTDPTQVGPHRVLAVLGTGGMGKVYLARTPARHLAAVKVVHRELAEDPSFRARFAREVRLAQMVHGPFTPAVFDAAPDVETPWMATEYAPGPTLTEAVVANGPFPEESLRILTLGLARALQAIHGAGLIHRDLKPSNVLLSPRGPQVIDFGIARAIGGTVLTKTGEAFGTPSYAAPETVLGQPQTPESDVFSLAGVVVYASRGMPPFGQGPAADVLHRIVDQEPDLRSLPEGTPKDLLARCLAKEPRDRPTANDIVEVLNSEPLPSPEHGWLPSRVEQEIDHRERELHRVPTAAKTTWSRTPSRGRRRTAFTVGATVTVLFLVTGTGIALTRPWESEETVAQTSEEPTEDVMSSETSADDPGPAFTEPVQGTYFSTDGDLLYVHTEENQLSLWDWREGELQEVFEEQLRVVDVKDDHVVGGFENRFAVWDSDQNKIASYEIEVPEGSTDITGVSVAEETPVALFTELHAGLTTTLHFWDWENDEEWAEEIDDPLWEALLSPDGDHIALVHSSHGDSSARVEVRKTDTMDLVHEVVHDDPDPDGSFDVNSLDVAFSSGSDLVATSSGFLETTEVHDLVDDKTVAEFETPYNPQGLEFTHDDARLLLGLSPVEALRSGGYQWDLKTEEELTSDTTLIYESPTTHPIGETIVVTDDSASTPTLVFLDPETLSNTHEIR